MILTAPHIVKAAQTDIPNRQEDEVLLKVSYGGICGTDLKIFEGQIKTNYPLVMGHEIVGSVLERPNGMEVKHSRVIVDPVLFCDDCFYCKNGATNLCQNGALLGRDKQGGFGEYVTVPFTNIYGLPDSVNDQDASLIQVLTTCMHAQRRAKIIKDEVVVIMGIGVTGLLHMQLAKLSGARLVICVTTSSWKHEMAETLGADAVYRSGKEAEAGIRKLTAGHGADLIIECTGQLSIFSEALNLARFGGRVMAYGIHTSNGGSFPFYQLYYKELNIINARAARSQDYPEAIDLVRKEMIKLSPLVTHIEPLSELPRVLQMLKDNKQRRMKIIINSSC